MNNLPKKSESKMTYRSYISSRSRSRDLKAPITSGPLFLTGTSKIKTPYSQKTAETSNIKEEFAMSKKKKRDDQYTAFEWQQIQRQAQKLWYDQEEGCIFDQQNQANKFYQTEKTKRLEEQMETRNPNEPRQNFEQKQKNAEHSKWELNRLMHSGLFQLNAAQQQEEQEKRVILMVHHLKPPFLDGNVKFTTQMQQIQIVKDPNSDMALLAKKGSQILKNLREKNQKVKNRERGWEITSKIGRVVKLQDRKREFNDQLDFKQNNRFANLLSKKTQAVSQFAKYKTFKQQRQYLPIFEVRQDLMKVLKEHKVVIIIGQTGSGKTTQLTQYLNQEGYCKYGIIGCTQPRRVAAVSVAKRVAQQMGVPLGTKVGYSIRFQDYTSQQTIIKYMTDGVLLRQSLNDPQLQKYSAIVMDQAHERSLNTDVLFGILMKVAQKRRDIKLIVTSATMNSKKFSEFFGQAPIFQIPGRTFPVQNFFQKGPVQDYVDAAVKKAIQVHLQQGEGDILIFMTGQQDIEATCMLIQQKIKKHQNIPPLIILPIYSQLRSQEQAKIFEPSKFRKCIVATNIAETSLTLDGVKYVIDSGFCKLKVYNPRIGMDALQVTPISQANANQRSGRAGRTGPGYCYRLYSAAIYRQDLFENNIPEIQRTNLCNVVLLLKSLNINNLLQFDFMDPPPQDTILNSMYQLWILGALDNLGNLTSLGKKMAQFPVDPPLSKMIIIGNELQCIQQILTIVSMISVPSIFFKPKDRQKEAEAAREKLIIPQSDHLTYLNVYQQWQKHDYSAQWTTQHFLQVKSLRKVREVRTQLKDIARDLGFKISSCNGHYDIVRKAICSGYFINAAKIKGLGDYVNLRTGMPCKLHPSSSLFSLGYIPQYIVYHQLIMTSKQFMNCVTTVDPYWLAQLGPMFFTVKSEFGGVKTKADIQRAGETMMKKQLNEAKKKQEEMQKKKQQEQKKQSEIRRMKSQYVVIPGRVPKTPLILKTPKHI